jgi:hypothetical protein
MAQEELLGLVKPVALGKTATLVKPATLQRIDIFP